ncbi:hypothetical protein P3T76_002662 [Phytophthora citrophthora]|uniref:Phytotoxin PcF domain-containing protein n=1 Tax=Phytophthora citrophthora TaxID=4793 RepID=A0AAD9GV32_9STRA|nr:hypothetical protein P3T76_002662 [Phytophthora citrophthora]
MNFKTCFALVLATVVATVATAEDPLYCQAVGCPTLYSESNLAVSRDCRDDPVPDLANDGGEEDKAKVIKAFHACCETKCAKPL